MNFDLFFVFVFYALVYAFYRRNKSKFTVQHKVFYMYKTPWGITLMQRVANIFAVPLHWISYLSIFVGFLGMVLMFAILIHGTWQLFFVPSAPPVVSPVLPGVSIPGLPTLSFWHWIISILVIAVVHEFSHGVFAKLYKIRVKSTGFAFFGPILAAFVEPDEKHLEKASSFKQLAVLSAGPFANIAFGFLVLAFSLLFLAPLASSVVSYDGVQIVSIAPDYPVSNSTLEAGFEVELLDGVAIESQDHFLQLLEKYEPGEFIELQGGDAVHLVELGVHPESSDKAMLGVHVGSSRVEIASEIRAQYGNFFPKALLWTLQLVFWVYVISLGVGLFNLLPLAFLDGGRMSYLGALFFVKDKKKAMKIFGFLSFVCLFLIFVNLVPYLWKFLAWVFGLVVLIF